ncbi:hypothetical protein Bca52824_065761 [Brassica carinata]|uniref:Rab-GAP TBC domain-containing protein n=1 Tax=Brassica carinata TaxID=52824 RepID=A0A8X7UCQ3_BRACI|nr:hypothetical protein Bca52824_065761 [Brassica carinata]
MVPLVGSGKFVAMAIVAEDSQPLEESSAENQESLVKTAVTDKRVLQWMLLGMLSQVIKTVDPRLHQRLGIHSLLLSSFEFNFCFAIRMLMVLFRREFSFLDAFYLWEMMWAMEYNPNKFASYEKTENGTKQDPRLLKQYGKFERNYIKSGQKEQHDSTLAVFVVANVLETKNKRLLKEARGLDDVIQILGGIAGNLDARKACKQALKIHEKFLRKVTTLLQIIRLLLL